MQHPAGFGQFHYNINNTQRKLLAITRRAHSCRIYDFTAIMRQSKWQLCCESMKLSSVCVCACAGEQIPETGLYSITKPRFHLDYDKRVVHQLRDRLYHKPMYVHINYFARTLHIYTAHLQTRDMLSTTQTSCDTFPMQQSDDAKLFVRIKIRY